jgi:hypothetical protein
MAGIVIMGVRRGMNWKMSLGTEVEGWKVITGKTQIIENVSLEDEMRRRSVALWLPLQLSTAP